MNEYSKNWHKARYERLKEQGICPRCGKEKAKEGKIHCQICLDEMKSYSSQKYQSKKGKELNYE